MVDHTFCKMHRLSHGERTHYGVLGRGVDCTIGTPIQFQALNHPNGSCRPAPLSSLAPTELPSVPEPLLLLRFLRMK